MSGLVFLEGHVSGPVEMKDMIDVELTVRAGSSSTPFHEIWRLSPMTR